jgi:hypothetical protein
VIEKFIADAPVARIAIVCGGAALPPTNPENASVIGDTCNSGGMGAMVIENCLETLKFCVSLAVTVNWKVPTVVGVPLKIPAVSVSPGGGVPKTAKLYPVPCGGENPPVTPNACEYAVPTTPGGKGDDVVNASADATVSKKVAVKLTGGWTFGTIAVTWIGNVPAAVGFPLRTPELLSVNPGGGDDVDHWYVPPPLIAVNVVE